VDGHVLVLPDAVAARHRLEVILSGDGGAEEERVWRVGLGEMSGRLSERQVEQH
jgi:hypothetical protein